MKKRWRAAGASTASGIDRHVDNGAQIMIRWPVSSVNQRSDLQSINFFFLFFWYIGADERAMTQLKYHASCTGNKNSMKKNEKPQNPESGR